VAHLAAYLSVLRLLVEGPDVHWRLDALHVSCQFRIDPLRNADDWEAAKLALIASEAFRQFSEAALPATVGVPLTRSDIFLMVPMTGLKHCWVMQGGRSGEYFTAVVVHTDDGGDVEESCDH
jgi:hypothetical protein